MHILFFSDNFVPETNAAANRVYERACYWTKWGHRVTVLTSAPNKPEGKVYPGYKNRWFAREMVQGIEVIRVKTFITKNEGFVLRLLDFWSYMFMSFFVGLFLTKPDVVCATSPQFFTAVSGWLVAKLRRLPYVLEVSDLWPGSISAVGIVKVSLFLRWAEKLELFLYRQAALVVTLTEAFKVDICSRGIDAGKIDVILNGVDLTRLAPQARDLKLAEDLGLSDKFVIGYLGTHGLAQGLPHVIDKIHQAAASPHLHFLFVGAGAERELVMERARAHNLSNITFVPSQPKSEMQRFWSVVDVALVSLKDDPVFKQFIPSKIFEAMGAGKPVLLLCPLGEAHAIIERTGSGWSMPPSDQVAFTTLLHNLGEQAASYAHYQSQSQRSAAQFSRQTQARLFIESLERKIPTSPAFSKTG